MCSILFHVFSRILDTQHQNGAVLRTPNPGLNPWFVVLRCGPRNLGRYTDELLTDAVFSFQCGRPIMHMAGAAKTILHI
jgi:hypothetical protein